MSLCNNSNNTGSSILLHLIHFNVLKMILISLYLSFFFFLSFLSFFWGHLDYSTSFVTNHQYPFFRGYGSPSKVLQLTYSTRKFISVISTRCYGWKRVFDSKYLRCCTLLHDEAQNEVTTLHFLIITFIHTHSIFTPFCPNMWCWNNSKWINLGIWYYLLVLLMKIHNVHCFYTFLSYYYSLAALLYLMVQNWW